MVMTLLHHLHSWLTHFAQSHNLKPQLELSRDSLHLVVGSPTLGRCEIGSILVDDLTTWDELEVYLESKRAEYSERIQGHLEVVKRWEVEEVLEVKLNG